jgi:phage-related protein
VVFRGTATLIIALLKLLSTPGNAAGGLIDNLRSIFSAIGEFVFDLIWDIISSVISGFFEFVGNAITGFGDLMMEAVMELLKLSKEGSEELFGLVQEIFGGLSEIISKLVVSILDNCQEAIGSIFQKIVESEP